MLFQRPAVPDFSSRAELRFESRWMSLHAMAGAAREIGLSIINAPRSENLGLDLQIKRRWCPFIVVAHNFGGCATLLGWIVLRGRKTFGRLLGSLIQLALVFQGGEELCVHCGLCAERCPTADWDMHKFDLEISYAGVCQVRTADHKKR
jgi:ferredoxin